MNANEYQGVLRRRLLGAVSAGVLLAACGGQSELEEATSAGGTHPESSGSDATASSGGNASFGADGVGDSSSGGSSTLSSDGSGGSNTVSGDGSGATSSDGSNAASGGGSSASSSGGSGAGAGGGGASSTSDSATATTASVECPVGFEHEFCLDAAQMEQQARHGFGEAPLDPPRSDEEVASGWDANGCMRHDWVATGCCNTGMAPGKVDGDLCCYVACEGSCCGRPLVVAGHAAVADAVSRNDWNGVSSTATDDLVEEQADLLARSWTRDALDEHASVAAFARFTLELMALGAPAELVRATQQAALDEVEHARLCFAIASRLARKPVGPGRLPEALAPLKSGLAELLVATIHEGCVGESLAAAVAFEQARVAREPEVKRALSKIAEDETRHAELAWRFVGWALAGGDRQLRRLAREAFEAAWSKPTASDDVGVPRELLQHWGRLTAADTARVQRLAIETALMPAARQLLNPPEHAVPGVVAQRV